MQKIDQPEPGAARREPGTGMALRDGLIALMLFAISLAVYLGSPIRQILDSNYTAMMAEHLLRHGDLDLKNEHKPPLDPAVTPRCSKTVTPATSGSTGSTSITGRRSAPRSSPYRSWVR